jgi:hypothetical protein
VSDAIKFASFSPFRRTLSRKGSATDQNIRYLRLPTEASLPILHHPAACASSRSDHHQIIGTPHVKIRRHYCRKEEAKLLGNAASSSDGGEGGCLRFSTLGRSVSTHFNTSTSTSTSSRPNTTASRLLPLFSNDHLPKIATSRKGNRCSYSANAWQPFKMRVAHKSRPSIAFVWFLAYASPNGDSRTRRGKREKARGCANSVLSA